MTLAQLIAAVAAADAIAGDFNAVAVTLNTASITKTDSTLRTANWLSLELSDPMPGGAEGETKADRVLGTIKTVGAQKPMVGAAYNSLCNNGIDLSRPLVQQMIVVLGQAGSWGDELTANVLSRGVWQVSPAVNAGLGTVTAEACQAAWEERVKNLLVTTTLNEIVLPALSNDNNTLQEMATALRAAADALEA